MVHWWNGCAWSVETASAVKGEFRGTCFQPVNKLRCCGDLFVVAAASPIL
jgi:hypothetical protein